MQGISFRNVATVTTFLVPNIGMRNVWMIRRVPPARPGMAASQKSCMVSNLNPMYGRRTTIALIMNHVAKDNTRVMVVMVSVRQAIFLPVCSQKPASSGFHSSNQPAEAFRDVSTVGFFIQSSLSSL